MMKLIKKTQKWMNTDITFQAYSEKESKYVNEIFELGFSEFARIVRKYSRFDPKSELSKINQIQDIWQEIDFETFNIFKYCLGISKYTEGIYDPTIIDILEIFGYGANLDYSKLDDRDKLLQELKEILNNRHNPYEIELKKQENKYLIKLNKNQRIEIGGMGKGYAIDQAADILKRNGLNNFLIDAGGDIRSNGGQEGLNYWLVGLWDRSLGLSNAEVDQNKQNSSSFMKLYSGDALCCSGGDARRAKFFHHLINPHTGFPEDNFSHVFAYLKHSEFEILNSTLKYATQGFEIEPIATMADTFSTVYFISGDDNYRKDIKGLEFLGIEK